MKISRLFTLLLLLTGLSVSGQSQDVSDQEVSDKPVIEFEVITHDFGMIKTSAPAFHYFVFTNKGEAPLVISNVRSSCGCTVPQWPRVPIMSGKSDSIRVEYNTRIKGAFNKSITVMSNATKSSVLLMIKGNVAD